MIGGEESAWPAPGKGMSRKLQLDDDRLFASDPAQRKIARGLYESVRDLPIISPHGHTDPAWFADNDNFTDATALLLVPDHYLHRMLYSQGIPLDRLGIAGRRGGPIAAPREAW